MSQVVKKNLQYVFNFSKVNKYPSKMDSTTKRKNRCF